MTARAWCAGAVVVALAAGGCSASGNEEADGESGGASGSGGNVSLTGGAGGGGGNVGVDAGSNGGSGGSDRVGEVYGHSASSLYKLEPFSGSVVKIGDFDCLGGLEMWDIAVDKDGNMVGVLGSISGGALASVDKATGKCTLTRRGSNYPNSLTYLPAGTLDPDAEALVGYSRTKYLRIDPSNGFTEEIGGLNAGGRVGGKTWTSSGDIVSVIGGKTYLTAREDFSLDEDENALLEVDPITGKALRLVGNTGQTQLYGLGYWAGSAYGFSAAGQLFKLNITTGAATEIPLSGLGALSFYGAGTTTAAPVDIPQ
jgi:hypothetical protein